MSEPQKIEVKGSGGGDGCFLFVLGFIAAAFMLHSGEILKIFERPIHVIIEVKP